MSKDRLLIWLICLVIAAAIQYPLPLNHDAAWHFETSFRVLAGDELGRDVFDINPPMSAWLFLLPAWLTDAVGASPALMFKTFTFVLCSGSCFWALSLIAFVRDRHSCQIMALAICSALLILPAYDFGQREHLVAALTLPYVALAIRRAEGLEHVRVQAVLIGIAAAAGICIKPYFLALPLCIESWLIFRRRCFFPLLRLELVSIGLFGVAYLVAVGIWAPAYYTRVVPDALVSYQGFDNPFVVVLVVSIQTIILALVSALLAYSAWGNGRMATPVQAFMGAALGFLIAALLQQKGWAYQLYPVKFYLVAAAGAIYALHQQPCLRRPLVLGVMVTSFLTIVGPVISFLDNGYSSTGTSARVAALENIFRHYSKPDQTVFAFITSPRDIHPALLQSRRRWAAAEGVMTYLPAKLDMDAMALNHSEDLQIEHISERENQGLLDRLTSCPPAIVVVDVKRKKLGIDNPGFSYIQYFMRYPRFREFWNSYRKLERVGGFDVYVRKASVSAVAGVGRSPDARVKGSDS